MLKNLFPKISPRFFRSRQVLIISSILLVVTLLSGVILFQNRNNSAQAASVSANSPRYLVRDELPFLSPTTNSGYVYKLSCPNFKWDKLYSVRWQAVTDSGTSYDNHNLNKDRFLGRIKLSKDGQEVFIFENRTTKEISYSSGFYSNKINSGTDQNINQSDSSDKASLEKLIQQIKNSEIINANNSNSASRVKMNGYNPGSDWQAQQIADFDGDSLEDILVRNSITGEVRIAYLENGNVKRWETLFYPIDSSWQIQGTMVNPQNLKAEILWRNIVSGDNSVWYNRSGTWEGKLFTQVPDLNWNMVGALDCDDGFGLV